MPSKAVEPGKRDRYPQQHVRPGRGVPGYTGDVDVYPTAKPASYEGDAGVSTLAAAEETEKTGYAAMLVVDLREELEKRGLSTDGNKGDLVARLEDDDSK